MSFEAQILADSIAPCGVRLTTFVVTFPRFILAEVNTHRMLSRNSASSRAIPISKMIDRVLGEPFVPERWPINQKGMQASAFHEVGSAEALWCEQTWLHARDAALEWVQRLTELEVHKQIANRLLEPFMWHTAIITATEWQNFFNLRTHKDAQPEFQKIARMMRELYEAETQLPRTLLAGEWHLPYIDFDDEVAYGQDRADAKRIINTIDWAQISSARCARVSYLTQDGVRDVSADLELAKRLQSSGHMSPFEHAAMALDHRAWHGNFLGWKSYRKFLPGEDVFVPRDGS